VYNQFTTSDVLCWSQLLQKYGAACPAEFPVCDRSQLNGYIFLLDCCCLHCAFIACCCECIFS